MVTHSKFPAAGMSRPLDTSLRLKTFSSKSEYQLVVNAVRKYIYSGGEKIPLVLSRPLSSNVATLQHLCRKTVNGHLDSYEKVTQLPGPIREFLDQYDAPL